MHIPRLVIAGLSGGAGKTMVSLGLARALTRRGVSVAPFKKGPDYIDAVWLGLAAKGTCSNLDPFFMSPGDIRSLFAHNAAGRDVALMEGNRGLFDGMDVEGSAATSALARLLGAPVVLVMDCTKMTRTAAAVAAGCRDFEPGLRLAGVVLNRVAGPRHEDMLRKAIGRYTDLAVLGALPKLGADPIPERHMGLISHEEIGSREAILDGLADAVEAHCDVEAMLALARSAPDWDGAPEPLWPDDTPEPRVRIGVVRDAALWFYYQENLEALRRAGAEVVEVSLLDPAPWPELHGLYLGGGFPETQARALAESGGLARLKALSDDGLPIYAECGGFMVLARELEFEGASWPMAGVFNVAAKVCARPQGLGYVQAEVTAANPYHPQEAVLAGHEFHYSQCVPLDAAEDLSGLPTCLRMQRGHGMDGRVDGLLHENTMASYTHIHALAAPWWALRFVQAAEKRKG